MPAQNRTHDRGGVTVTVKRNTNNRALLFVFGPGAAALVVSGSAFLRQSSTVLFSPTHFIHTQEEHTYPIPTRADTPFHSPSTNIFDARPSTRSAPPSSRPPHTLQYRGQPPACGGEVSRCSGCQGRGGLRRDCVREASARSDQRHRRHVDGTHAPARGGSDQEAGMC